MNKWVILGTAILAWGGHELLSRQGFMANYGVSFGWGKGMGIAVLVVVMAVVWYLYRKNTWIFLIGGMINITDRLRFGFVRDYWKLPVVPLYNNLADWLLVAGLVVIIGGTLWKRSK